MKTKTKALVLSLCAVLLVVSTVFVTSAFLTSQDQVTNTFTVGKVKIVLDEADVKPDGTYETDANSRVKTNVYHLIPGHEYIKDPTIHVDAGSENCWLFVKLENGLKGIIAPTAIEDQMQANGWNCIDAARHIWAYKEVASAGTDVVVFKEFTIDKYADVSGYETAGILVTAYGIQADGFATVEEAWNAAGTGLK